ncbi:biotin-dependent carboxyltransferase family protein [Salsuginibacillus kocurii]|uniref:5-oxoprolinase subunit C family protein n=1 Tax=Salsuginibacillus kocurii TaxID=427078 RepID=UPI0003704460|nr:biotin-dependent carboxyltransferase family protein [Salsuginibacillus kocurii]
MSQHQQVTSQPIARVVRPGLFTTIQDSGRIGFQQDGIPVSGAMDPFALELTNTIVGNPADTAAIEVTMQGPTLRFEEETLVAIGGANLGAYLNDVPFENWSTRHVIPGDEISFRIPVSGVRAYIAVAGGFDARVDLGSCSTFTKASLGGLEGRAFKKEDQLAASTLEWDERFWTRRRKRPDPAVYARVYHDGPLRAIAGPEWDAFTDEAQRAFCGEEFTISDQADRMGYRLKGPKLEQAASADILSDAVAFGTIQVAADGQPMVLMADRQTTGGYTRIGSIIRADWPRLAQMAPGEKIRFELVTVNEAHQAYTSSRKHFETFKKALPLFEHV